MNGDIANGSLKKGLLMVLTGGAGFGASMAILLAVADVIKKQPQLFLEIMRGWGPMALIVIIGMVFANQRIGDGVQVMRDTTKAQQELADAVKSIAARDDERAREQDLILGEIARNSRETKERLGAIEQRLEGGGGGRDEHSAS